MTKPNGNTTLERSSGADARSVGQYIADYCSTQPKPQLAWAEPTPSALRADGARGRRRDFVPFVQGALRWPADLVLVEARMFWDTAALHVVADPDGGCRWARIEESASGQDEVVCSYVPVQTLRDRARFGLGDDGQISARLTAVEYRRNGHLVAWRLTIAEGGPHA